MGNLSLKDLKQQYSSIAKKYSMPEFELINQDFEIDKIDSETDCLLRIIRKVIMEKIVNSISFLEMMINPVNTPRIYFPFIKSMSVEDKNLIEKIYDVLAELSLSSLALEINYSEEKEAKMIKTIHKEWNNLKPNFSKIVTRAKMPSVSAERKDKSYFG